MALDPVAKITAPSRHFWMVTRKAFLQRDILSSWSESLTITRICKDTELNNTVLGPIPSNHCSWSQYQLLSGRSQNTGRQNNHLTAHKQVISPLLPKKVANTENEIYTYNSKRNQKLLPLALVILTARKHNWCVYLTLQLKWGLWQVCSPVECWRWEAGGKKWMQRQLQSQRTEMSTA